MKILSVKNIEKKYPIQKGVFKRTIGYAKILKGISFSIEEGETLAIVGESGCGKSTLARIIMCLEKPTAGSIYYQSKQINKLNHKELMPIRKDVQISFQDTSSALNDRFTVKKIIEEPLIIHKIGTKEQRLEKVKKVLAQVELADSFLDRYQHELSGGQRQRIAIARSVILEPKLLLLDEPLSALDVSLQGQMIELFRKLQKELNLTIIIISHDLGLVEEFSDRTIVLNFGKIAEINTTKEIFKNPKNEYTKQLLASIPNKSGKTRF